MIIASCGLGKNRDAIVFVQQNACVGAHPEFQLVDEESNALRDRIIAAYERALV